MVEAGTKYGEKSLKMFTDANNARSFTDLCYTLSEDHGLTWTNIHDLLEGFVARPGIRFYYF